MPQKLKLASAQARTLSTTADTLSALEETTKRAVAQGIDIILFPEAYLGGYPRTCSFGAAVGARAPEGREQFLQYFHAAVDLGDTPTGAGQAWVDRKLELPRGKEYRGDGTREELERIARETGIFVVTGLVERSGGTLYCGVVFVCPRFGILGKRRKVMPTGSERLIWGQGSASTLRAVTTEIKGVRLCMGSAICWENYMPLLRQSLYAQNVNLWFAPTADARDTWESLMRTVGCEGRCFVLSANQCVRKKHLPEWIAGGKGSEQGEGQSSGGEYTPRERGTGRRRSTITVTEDKHEICWPVINAKNDQDSSASNDDTSAIDSSPLGSELLLSPKQTPTDMPTQTSSAPQASTSEDEEFVSRGGSCIVSPLGEVLAGPLWEEEDELLVTEVDFEDCERGRLDFDSAGSYSRMDSFRLSVEGLNMDPPPF
ncbi:carbon-nitrogen hydrolase [Dothidotthia symphoricarpi CBS 119687]|uniref:Carbon-nitrogen hydrolase n=1 Tax=Dothidotthia symphoricarpi CBS 119687 TaxID=1392245 RepID=A0A6A6A0Q4_9PLEO|nr:carbon-nitrogen hydrolase [Dothidotthia symphoricarpi CBS 119687]KAF2124733.1 carbon-nitrogen hydrolase [Dothidotthia symphoricarpi CBS 119687]